jgi:hypothetical protein
MRAAVSETVMSGSLPMSSATTASTIWSLFRLMLRADCSERLRPVTTIAFSGVCGASALCAGSAGLCCAVASGFGGNGAWSCAAAGDAIAHAAAIAVVDQSKVFKRRISRAPPCVTNKTV